MIVALPGVQRFIAEARSTSDVSAASGIYAALAGRVVETLEAEPGGTLVLPVRDDPSPGAATPNMVLPAEDSGRGLPNRIVALLPAEAGVAAARRASEAAHDAWRSWLRQVMRLAEGDPPPQTPAFPRIQWVCVPELPSGYEAQWQLAQRLLAARRRIGDFTAVPEEDWRQRDLCSLAPRWPAERKAPPDVPPYEQRTPLSAVGWVKRRWRHVNEVSGFPSTASIASAPYRRGVLRHLTDPEVAAAVRALDGARQAVERALGTSGRETPLPGLEPLVPDGGPGAWLARSGGPWVYAERWRPETLVREAATGPAHDVRPKVRDIEQAVRDGYRAARRLGELMEQPGRQAPPLASYLAVVVQDLDSMGRFLGGGSASASGQKIPIMPNEHARVSRELLLLAEAQTDALKAEKLLAVPVYAGGDDLLAFCPASTAIDAAQSCHDEIPRSLPHASTAVLFFHYHASIQQAMRAASDLLKDAKLRVRGKHALAVGYLRRSGVGAQSIQPWTGQDGASSAVLFGLFAREREPKLSPRLVADLEHDAGELAALAEVSQRLHRPLYTAELARLVRRHAGTDASGHRETIDRVAAALDWLGRNEHAGESPGPELAARVGVFLRQEAR
ncbi:MAG: Cas10/Cmr2 second palm domain-containing protein [Streptosporangiaceae bacterium]